METSISASVRLQLLDFYNFNQPKLPCHDAISFPAFLSSKAPEYFPVRVIGSQQGAFPGG